MGSFKVFDRQARRFVAAVALLFASVTPALVPALASAATVTERSVQLSTSAKGADGVSYEVRFKTASQTNTGAFVIDFCTDAAIGAACTPPTGLDVGATPSTTGSDTVSAIDTNSVKVELASPVTTGNEAVVTIGGLSNPDAAETIYARIVTYQDGTTNYHYTDEDTLGTYLDDGTVALSITNDIGVTGSVLETLLFCASSEVIDEDCLDSGGQALDLPSVSLGANGILGETLSEGTIYSQISTNASNGAVVNLKSDTTGCGGLVRQGASSNATGCGIAPVSGSAAAIGDGDAKFGVKLGGLTAVTGAVTPVASYNTTNYFMNYVDGDESGVTSTYGDPIYNTGGNPVNNGSVSLTFGANISNTTPAGNYSATLNLIATGKF